MNQDKLNDIERRLKILSISISDAIEAVQVWRMLIAPETHDKYKTQLRIYVPFFKATRQAVFVSTVTSLGRFSDKTKKVVSAPNILRDLKKHKFETSKVKKLKRLTIKIQKHGKILKYFEIVFFLIQRRMMSC